MLLSTALFLSVTLVRSLKTNRTLDDEQQDSEIGTLPSYSPSADGWSQGAKCPACGVNVGNVDLEQVHDGTWHDGTYRPGGDPLTITVTFTGTAVYVYNILANNILPTITFTNISFYLDGDYVEQFIHAPDDSSIMQYNVLVFHAPDLANAPHTLLMSASGDDISLILFDYLLYTIDDSPASQPSPSSIAVSKTPSSPARTSLAGSTSAETVDTVTSTILSTELASLSTTAEGGAALTSASIPPSSPTKDSTIHPATTFLMSSSTSTIAPTRSPTISGGFAHSMWPAAGAALLGCIGLLALVCMAFWLRRRHQRSESQKVGPSNSVELLLNEDFDGLPNGGPGSPCGGIPRLRNTSETMPSYSSAAFATLGASVHGLSSDRTLVMRDSIARGKRC